jgi:hypothetical protein
VDVAGIEPATHCLQNKSAGLRKAYDSTVVLKIKHSRPRT